ncbi:hypothetical protein STHU_17800 [Allostella humosa]|uniref:NAD(P)/FAD-dependent oxidoreductase n=1 Tax=Stella humosa TaxID=94 RepID=UPI001138D891|nr:FAD-binding oxidoreductase [Stella humosa]BBK31146.1 hypothetical protein STHU_17800 [Stella humosa]
MVVIGGGVIGASVAYHLCRAGVTDVLVLERNTLSSGATPRAAGLITHGRADANVIGMMGRTIAAIAELENLLGEPIEFRPVGSIRSVATEAGERALAAIESALHMAGTPLEVIDARRAREACPWLDLSGARRTLFFPRDGHVDGARLGMAYARAARRLGARVRQGVEVQGLLREGNTVTGVLTSAGPVRAQQVVDAAGAWAGVVSEWAGWAFPATPTRSQYWMTAPDGNGPPTMPIVQLPELHAYLRPEVGGLVVGLQEPNSTTFDPFELPTDMGAVPVRDQAGDLDFLIARADALRTVIPGIDDWRFVHHITGLSMYTPDGNFVIGRPDGVEGLIAAGGCCGSGVAASGGFGEAVASLVTGQPCGIDMVPFRPSRFGGVGARDEAFRQRCSAARGGKSGLPPGGGHPA